MKKFLISAAFLMLSPKGKACADYYPDGDYFNLFAQTIIKDKTYIPFLLNYGAQFYDDGEKRMIPDENIYAWQKLLGNKLDYRSTEFLVNHMPMSDLNAYKHGNSSNQILNKLGNYSQNSEAIDYLIEAKYLEPYMRIQFVESPDPFYYHDENSVQKNATDLNESTISSLISLYQDAKNPEIKQRYGYQIVRYYHYTRNFEQAIDAFKTFVEPIKLRSVPYYYALDQMAGAQRGLKMNEEANWNFFQVFMNAPSKKEGAFVSMKLSDSTSFKNILARTKTPEEKNFAYFLLGYSDFTNPIHNMEKMYEINPDSEILKVMAARSINQLERNYLPAFIYQDDEDNSAVTKKSTQNSEKEKAKAEDKKESFWDKIVGFFKNIFGGKKERSTKETRNNNADDDDLLNNPNRIPIYEKKELLSAEEKSLDYLDEFSKFTEKTKAKSKDEFWQIADAYLKFLQKNYDESKEILSSIKTTNPEYQAQISRMKILNDIVSQPRIDSDFENHMTKDYPNLFVEEAKEKDSTQDYYYRDLPTTADFIKDILANRYFLQGEDGKSFLMSNSLSDLQYYPNVEIAKKVQEFVHKKDKTALEQNLMMSNVDLKNPDAFFNIIYGDAEMRKGKFADAKNFYAKVINFEGIPRFEYEWEHEQPIQKKLDYAADAYDGFKNISDLVFGHNVWESFQSPQNQSMTKETFADEFSFITPNMDKLQLADALVQLQKNNSANANQLIGNLLYNTSSLGYFREIFIMDIDNSGWSKNDVERNSYRPNFKNYYKNYTWKPALEPDNFDVAMNFYQKALKASQNPEQKARILFQLASAEQGKYFQWAATQNFDAPYSDQWQAKQDAFVRKLGDEKNAKYRTYFSQLKSQYSQTQTAKDLRGSCTYFDYFMKK